MSNTASVFDGALGESRVASPDREKIEYRAPNFIRMDRAVALERARKLGCNVLCQGDEGRVVAQSPDPGIPMDRDGVIRLVVSAPAKSGGTGDTTPDLIGMPVREAKAKAARSGFRCVLVGSGIVKKQSPKAGLRSGNQLVKLYCEATGGAGKRKGS